MSLGFTLNEPQINLGSAKVPEHLIYEFHDFRLDAVHLMLYRGEIEMSLTPKQVETLLALVEKSGEIVSKDDLMSRLWGDTAVEDANLIQNIHSLRKVLGDTPDGRPMIETLRRRGYRFTAEIKSPVNERTATAIERAVPADEPTISEKEPWFQQRPIAITLALIGLVGLVIVAASFISSSRSAEPGRITQFAVLPLKPVDESSRSGVYETGIAESLINRLNSIHGFGARPLSAVRNYSSLDQDAVAAGREQKVDLVIAPNYQIANGMVRVTAQLVSVETGAIEDTILVETAEGSIFTLQDTVADTIAKRLVARFNKQDRRSDVRRGTDNEEAYRLYLQGKNLTMRRSSDSYKKAVEYFEQAIKIDPNYALAYARMAQIFVPARFGERAAEIEEARAYVKKALELDPSLSEAYVSRANISALYDWNFAAAEADYIRALELDPNNDNAHWLYSLHLSDQGKFDEALREIDAARSIDPGAVVYMFHRGRILYYARRYQEAINQYQQAIDLDDRFIQPFGWMVRVYETQGDYASAFDNFLKREARSPRKDRLESYQKAYDSGGWMAVRREGAEAGTASFDLARLHSLLGEKDAAFEELNKALEEQVWLMTTLRVEPAFDNLRNDPRFDELVRRIGI